MVEFTTAPELLVHTFPCVNLGKSAAVALDYFFENAAEATGSIPPAALRYKSFSTALNFSNQRFQLGI
jgi:hypothetical protein